MACAAMPKTSVNENGQFGFWKNKVWSARQSSRRYSPPGDTTKVRIKAAKDFGKQGSAAIPKLTPMLSDPEISVRVEVVKALVEAGSQHSLDPLVQATKEMSGA